MIVLQNIWWLLVLIGVMILIHELGHYWAARFFDVRVDAFSFGFGPRLFGFRKGETDFRFSLILFGGYVKMAGEQPGEENAHDPRAFLAKPRWQRLIIAFAGPFMNIVLAVAVLTGLFMVHFPKLPNIPDPVVGYVSPEGAAAKAGVREGDKIVQIDNKTDPTWEDIAMREIASAGHAMDVWALRNGERLHFVVTPVLGVSLVAYFAYHLVQGDRGFIAWLRLNQEVREAKLTLAAVAAERETIEHRVSLLRPEHLDRDMLDERARSQLNLIGPNEIVIFNTPVSR